MNLSHPNAPPFVVLSASVEHEANDVVEPPSPPPCFLGHRKKFLDPISLSFSFLSKPEYIHSNKKINIPNHFPFRKNQFFLVREDYFLR